MLMNKLNENRAQLLSRCGVTSQHVVCLPAHAHRHDHLRSAHSLQLLGGALVQSSAPAAIGQRHRGAPGNGQV